ncbi:MAG: hypothetical protein HWN67_19985, partial [Candidatus Helarchaeota archaeon]|nr:hypothetical protein [Candidatus Helarchaeota archaeon]
MTKILPKAFFLVFLILGSFYILTTVRFNNFNLISGLNLNQNRNNSPIDDIKILDSTPPNITYWKFNSTPFNSTDTLTWIVNETANVTVTVTDKSGVNNVTLWYDTELNFHAGPEYIEMIPDQEEQNLTSDENATISGITLDATSVNNINGTYILNDSFYQTYANGSSGILWAYAVNLSKHVLNYSNIFSINITVRAFINDTTNVSWAGWQILNNNTKQLDDINPIAFNSTNNVTDSIILNSNNLTDYINDSRIEIFINVSSTYPVKISVDYVGFNVIYNSDNYTGTLPRLPWERIAWDGQKWTYKKDIVEFWVETFDVYDNRNITDAYKFNYSIIDVTPPQYNFSLSNESYVGGVARIEIRALDFESGISNITLAIDGNVTEDTIWDDLNDFKSQDPYIQNISVYYDWNVTAYENFNNTPGTNATHFLNFTIWNRQGLINSSINHTIYIDNEDPYGAYLNLRTNQTLELNATCLENATVTVTILNATDFQNSVYSTYQWDNISHSYLNASAGILMAYAVEL